MGKLGCRKIGQSRDFPQISTCGTKSFLFHPRGQNPRQHSTKAILRLQWQSPAIALMFSARSVTPAMRTKSGDASTLGERLWPMGCAFCFLLLPQREGNRPSGSDKMSLPSGATRHAKSMELAVRNLGSKSWQYNRGQIK